MSGSGRINFVNRPLRAMLVGLILQIAPGTATECLARPNLQEMRAQQAAQAEAERRKQEVAIFKKRRDELLSQYKEGLQARNQAARQMKIDERDYRTAIQQLNNARTQSAHIEARLRELRKITSKENNPQAKAQIDQLQKEQIKLVEAMKTFQMLQDRTSMDLRTAEGQYQDILGKLQIVQSQVEQVQRQLEFVVSQP